MLRRASWLTIALAVPEAVPAIVAVQVVTGDALAVAAVTGRIANDSEPVTLTTEVPAVDSAITIEARVVT